MSPISFFVAYIALTAVSVMSKQFFVGNYGYWSEGDITVNFQTRNVGISCGSRRYSKEEANRFASALNSGSRFRVQHNVVAPNWIQLDVDRFDIDKRENNYGNWKSWSVEFFYTNLGIHADEAGIKDFQKAALEFHNQQRAKHGCNTLEWDEGLSKQAQEAANKWAKSKGKIKTGGHAANTATMEYTTGVVPPCGADAVNLIKSWYDDGVKNYNYDLGALAPHKIAKMTQDCATFINMVWNETTLVGFGIFYDIEYKDNIVFKSVHIVALYNKNTTLATEALQANISKPE